MNSTNGCVNGYMTEKEAAKYLGLSPATLKTSRSKGVLIGAKPPTYYTFGRSVRYRKEDLDDWSSRVYKKVEGGVCESEKAESEDDAKDKAMELSNCRFKCIDECEVIFEDEIERG